MAEPRPDAIDPFNTKRPMVYEISGWRWVAFLPLAGLLYLYLASLRFRVAENERELLREPGRPRLVVVWHNRGLVAPMMLSRLLKADLVTILVSPSRMAAWQAAFFKFMGFPLVRGSSTRRSVQGTLGLLRALRSGSDAAVAPDGPSGPLYSFKPGAVSIARKAGVPMLLMIPNSRTVRHLNGWDRHFVPLPFSRIDVRLKVIQPEESLWSLPVPEACAELRRVCLEMTDDHFNVAHHEH